MKILLVENDSASLKLACDILQLGGHVVMLAVSADQAIETVQTVRPDVILLDLKLPHIEGLAVARYCRRDPALVDIPIVAVTAYPLDYSWKDARDVGCDDYIQKPLNTRTLTERLERLARTRHPVTGPVPDHSRQALGALS